MPVLSIFLVPVTAVLHVIYSDRRASPSFCPILALVLSTLSLIGWITQLSIWMHCELHESIASSNTFCPVLRRDGTRTAKVLMAWAAVVSYLVHMGAVIYGIVREKRERRNIRVRREDSLIQIGERLVEETEALQKRGNWIDG